MGVLAQASYSLKEIIMLTKTILNTYTFKVGDHYESKGITYVITLIERDHTVFATMYLKEL